jgi:hypothetical protein
LYDHPQQKGAFAVATEKITIHVDGQHVGRFFSLLESGFWIPSTPGDTITDLVVSGLGVDRDYLKDEIQTIFLNGRPVDDPDQACVVDGDRVAFSASMPGLLGATMRKGGYFRAMRQSISHCPNAASESHQEPFWVMIKCFNMIARELAPHLLGRGIWLDTGILRNYIIRRILPQEVNGTWQTDDDRSGPLSTLPAALDDGVMRYWVCMPEATVLKS